MNVDKEMFKSVSRKFKLGKWIVRPSWSSSVYTISVLVLFVPLVIVVEVVFIVLFGLYP